MQDPIIALNAKLKVLIKGLGLDLGVDRETHCCGNVVRGRGLLGLCL